MHRTLYAVAALLLTAACAQDGLTVVRPAQFDYAYAPSFQNNVAKYGDVPTLVLGNPFDEPIGEVETAVTDSLQGTYFGPELTFAAAKPETEAPYRLLVIFNPAPSARADRACAKSDQPLQPSEKGVSVMMVLCASDYRVSSTVGFNPGVDTSQGPEFAGLMRRTLATLLPPREFDINSPENRRRS